MKRRGPEKYLGKKQYEKHLKHMVESSEKAKLYVNLSDKYMLPEYNCHANDEAYLRMYDRGEVIRILNEDYSDFQSKLLKKHWFLADNFVLGANFLRFERFCLQKFNLPTGWESEKLPDQCSFLQFVRYFDRTNC